MIGMKLHVNSTRWMYAASVLLNFLLNDYSFGQCTAPDVNLGPDTNVCAGTPVALSNLNGFTYTTYLWDNGSQNPNRTVYQSGTYWLEGRTLGSNVVVNGDFEQGNTGFSTSYTVGAGGTYGQLSNEGTYAINTSPSNVHSNFTSCNDHTPTPGTQMMIVNGSSTPNTTVWSQTVNIVPYTNYQFSVWAASAVSSPNLAVLQFSINNAPVGGTFSPSTTAGIWGNFFQIWNSGANSTATISIVNQATASSGNDFMIDDISLAPMCKTRDSIVVNMFQTPSINLGNDQTICLGSSTTLDAGANIDTYNWSTGDTTQSLSIQTAGTYWVTGTNGNLCSATDTIVIQTQNQINAGPDTNLVICSTQPSINLFNAIPTGINNTGSWLDVDNTTNGNLSNNGTLTSNGLIGNYSCYYLLSDPYCPEDTAIYTVTINQQPNAGPDGLTHLCNDNTVTNINTLISPVTSHASNWTAPTLPNGSFDSNTGNLIPNGLSRDYYPIYYTQLADSMCSNDTARVLVRISELPQVDFTSDLQNGCAPIVVQFSDLSSSTGNIDYKWSFGQGDSSFLQNPNITTFPSPGLYAVNLQLIADSLCVNEETKNAYIEVFANPIADFQTTSYEILESAPTVDFTNKSVNGDFFTWNFGDGTSSSDFEPQHTFPVDTDENFLVTLVVETSNGCIDSTFQVYQVERSTLVFIPNSFTPDADQYNNTFVPIFSSINGISAYRFQIFNRWGQLIFESQDTQVGWDGTSNNRFAPEGTYHYRVQYYSAKDGNTHQLAGHVFMLR